MKVLFFSHAFGFGGSERSLLELINELKDFHITSKVVLPKKGLFEEYLKKNKIEYYILPFAWWSSEKKRDRIQYLNLYKKSFKNINSLILIIKKFNPDIVYTNTSVIPWGAIVAYILKKPHVWHVREFGYKDHGLHFDLGLNKSLKFINRYSDLVITNSENLRDYLDKHLIKRVIVAYNYINIPKHQNLVKLPFDKNHKSIILMSCSSLNYKKRQLDLVKAVSILIKRNIKVVLYLLGETNKVLYVNKILSYINKNNLHNYIKILGLIDNPYPYMNRADIIINTSLEVAFGRVTVEAMKLKKPVIGADSGFTTKLIKNGYNGYLYKAGDPIDLANKISLIISLNNFNKLGDNGFKYVNGIINKRNYGGVIAKELNKIMKKKVDTTRQNPYLDLFK